MSDGGIIPGTILHWEGFKFRDGAEADKFFVIVGAQKDQNFLAIVATSQQWRRSANPGGNVEGGYYFIPGGGKDWFPKDTWLLFEEPVELSASELVKLALSGVVKVRGNLRGQVANEICNTMRRCDDVSEAHRTLLGPAR